MQTRKSACIREAAVDFEKVMGTVVVRMDVVARPPSEVSNLEKVASHLIPAETEMFLP